MRSSRQVAPLPKPVPVLRGHGAAGPGACLTLQQTLHGHRRCSPPWAPLPRAGNTAPMSWGRGLWALGRVAPREGLPASSGPVPRAPAQPFWTFALDSPSPHHHQLLLLSASRHFWKRSLMKGPPLFLFQIWLLLGTWFFLHQPGACRQEPLLHRFGGSLGPLWDVAGLWAKLTLEAGWQNPQGRDCTPTVVRTT